MSAELLVQYLLTSELSPADFARECGITVAEFVDMVGGVLPITEAVDNRGAELADTAIRRNLEYC